MDHNKLHNRIQRDMLIYRDSRKFSKTRGLTQVELAKKYDLSQGHISVAIKTGKFWVEFVEGIESTNGFPGHLDNTGEEQE